MDIQNFAVIISGLDEEYQFHIISGINQYAREHRINISYFAAFGGMVDSKRFDIGEYSIYSLTDFTKFDGALVITNTFGDAKIRTRIMERVREAEIPAVVFETKDYPDFHDISIDNFSVAGQSCHQGARCQRAQLRIRPAREPGGPRPL